MRAHITRKFQSEFAYQFVRDRCGLHFQEKKFCRPAFFHPRVYTRPHFYSGHYSAYIGFRHRLRPAYNHIAVSKFAGTRQHSTIARNNKRVARNTIGLLICENANLTRSLLPCTKHIHASQRGESGANR